MKEVLVRSYEGEVLVKCANNMKREDVIEAVRAYLQEQRGEAIYKLSNVEYLTESKYLKEKWAAEERGEGFLFENIDTIEI